MPKIEDSDAVETYAEAKAKEEAAAAEQTDGGSSAPPPGDGGSGSSSGRDAPSDVDKGDTLTQEEAEAFVDENPDASIVRNKEGEVIGGDLPEDKPGGSGAAGGGSGGSSSGSSGSGGPKKLTLRETPGEPGPSARDRGVVNDLEKDLVNRGVITEQQARDITVQSYAESGGRVQSVRTLDEGSKDASDLKSNQNQQDNRQRNINPREGTEKVDEFVTGGSRYEVYTGDAPSTAPERVKFEAEEQQEVTDAISSRIEEIKSRKNQLSEKVDKAENNPDVKVDEEAVQEIRQNLDQRLFELYKAQESSERRTAQIEEFSSTVETGDKVVVNQDEILVRDQPGQTGRGGRRNPQPTITPVEDEGPGPTRTDLGSSPSELTRELGIVSDERIEQIRKRGQTLQERRAERFDEKSAAGKISSTAVALTDPATYFAPLRGSKAFKSAIVRENQEAAQRSFSDAGDVRDAAIEVATGPVGALVGLGAGSLAARGVAAVAQASSRAGQIAKGGLTVAGAADTVRAGARIGSEIIQGDYKQATGAAIQEATIGGGFARGYRAGSPSRVSADDLSARVSEGQAPGRADAPSTKVETENAIVARERPVSTQGQMRGVRGDGEVRIRGERPFDYVRVQGRDGRIDDQFIARSSVRGRAGMDETTGTIETRTTRVGRDGEVGMDQMGATESQVQDFVVRSRDAETQELARLEANRIQETVRGVEGRVGETEFTGQAGSVRSRRPELDTVKTRAATAQGDADAIIRDVDVRGRDVSKTRSEAAIVSESEVDDLFRVRGREGGRRTDVSDSDTGGGSGGQRQELQGELNQGDIEARLAETEAAVQSAERQAAAERAAESFNDELVPGSGEVGAAGATGAGVSDIDTGGGAGDPAVVYSSPGRVRAGPTQPGDMGQVVNIDRGGGQQGGGGVRRLPGAAMGGAVVGVDERQGRPEQRGLIQPPGQQRGRDTRDISRDRGRDPQEVARRLRDEEDGTVRIRENVEQTQAETDMTVQLARSQQRKQSDSGVVQNTGEGPRQREELVPQEIPVFGNRQGQRSRSRGRGRQIARQVMQERAQRGRGQGRGRGRGRATATQFQNLPGLLGPQRRDDRDRRQRQEPDGVDRLLYGEKENPIPEPSEILFGQDVGGGGRQ